MRLLSATLIACALLTGCATDSATSPPGNFPRAGDGTTRETAVKIRTMDDLEANRMMARWLKANYPLFKVMDQQIDTEYGNTYNVATIAGPNQTVLDIYFDISLYARRSNDRNSPHLPPGRP